MKLSDLKYLKTNTKPRQVDIYYTIEAPEYNALKVSIFYNKGGLNYFTYKQEARGYYAGIKPVLIENRGSFSTEQSLMLGREAGGYVELEHAKRFSKKRLNELIERGQREVEPYIDNLLRTIKAKEVETTAKV